MNRHGTGVMAKNRQRSTTKAKGRRGRAGRGANVVVGLMFAGLMLAGVALVAINRSGVPATDSSATQAAPETTAPSPDTPKVETMETNKAVMVTVELDFGGPPPSIAEALTQIERVHQPADGQGRTFAILDAYGEPTPDGKLHMSMHVSSEKPGLGSLVFKRTGEVLWKSRILQGPPATSPYANKQLVITVAENEKSAPPLDASNGATDLLDTIVSTKGVALRDFWKDGEQRELTFFYSTCGCPVKVPARRVGDRIVRTSDMPVLFPDDPQAMVTINNYLKWATRT